MTAELAKQALTIFASGDFWQPIMRETPVFVNGEGPFLIRGERLMPISYRTAWALLRQGLTLDNGAPVSLPTYSSGWIKDESVKQYANILELA